MYTAVNYNYDKISPEHEIAYTASVLQKHSKNPLHSMIPLLVVTPLQVLAYAWIFQIIWRMINAKHNSIWQGQFTYLLFSTSKWQLSSHVRNSFESL